MLSQRIITKVENFSTLQEVWEVLSADDSRANLFNSYAWIESWLKHYWSADYQLMIVVIERDQKPLAILPLYLNTKSRVLLFLGTGEPEYCEVSSEYLDFIVGADPVWMDEIYDYIAAYLAGLEVPSIEFINCIQNSHVFAVSALMNRVAYVVTGNQCQLELTTAFHSDGIGTSTKQRKKNRQLMNRFNGADELSVEIMLETDYQKHWGTLKALHQQDWKSRGREGAFISHEFNNFHKAMHDQYPEIKQYFSLLSFRGEVISIHHYYRYKDILYFYLTGTVKDAHRRLSPGMMLHVLCISNLRAQLLSYDFMKGAIKGSYKEVFCERGDSFYTLTIYNKGLLGYFRYFLHKLRKLKAQFKGLA